MATAKKAAPKAKASAPKLVEKNYVLLKYSPLTFTLKVGRKNSLLVFDETTQRNRAIRHCPGEPSIYVDEQSEDAVVVPIIFLKGTFSTKPTDVFTQDFLEAHPSKGAIFEIVDEVSDAKDVTDMEELKLDIKQAIREKAKEETGIEELRIIVSVLISDEVEAAKMETAQIKNTMYELVESNINRFIDDNGEISIFDDVEIKREAISQHAFNSGVIQISADGSKIMWSDNKATICQVPIGQNHKEFFAKYLGTEEGLQVAVEISQR